MTYIVAGYDWNTGDTITAARLDSNVSAFVDGLNAGTKAVNVSNLEVGSTSVITTGRQLENVTKLTVDNIVIDANDISSASGDVTITPLAGQKIVLDGTINVDAGVVTGATSITSTAFVGDITGDVTGNTSGTAATVTGATQAAITTCANLVTVGALNSGSITSGFGSIDNGASAITTTGTVSATTLTGTLSTAAQTNVTSLGTLTTLTVDNITLNGSTISHATATNLVITATVGNAVAVEGVSFDGGVVTGASSVTSTAFVGAGLTLTGNITTTATAIDWDLLDNDLAALSIDAPSQASMLVFDTSTGGAGQRITTSVPFFSKAIVATGAISTTTTLGVTGVATFTAQSVHNAGLSDGTFSGSAGTYTGGVSITSTAFIGALTGNASTVSTITGLAPDTATTQAAQPNITSLGTLTSLTVTGAISGATATDTINGVIINAGAVSGVTTLAGTGAITGFTTGVLSSTLAINGATAIGAMTIMADTGKSTANSNMLQLMSTGDGANYLALVVTQEGAAAARDRIYSFQTIEQGVANAGSIKFQGAGGNVQIGTGAIPASVEKSLILFNGTDPSASATNGVVMWSKAGEMNFRAAGGGITRLGTSSTTLPGALGITGAVTGVTTLANSGVHTNSNATSSTTTTTGALKVAGGVGIVENLNVGGVTQIILPTSNIGAGILWNNSGTVTVGT